MKKKYEVIGLMSGTSLDGLDIAFCEFRYLNNRWEFNILIADTVRYDQVWVSLLKEAPNLDGVSLSILNTSYGHWIGQTVQSFIRYHKIRPQLIASHGHTVFHSPSEKMTLQIGSGAAIAAETGIITINDFRALNIALGGQGAPLVPIGDQLLFSDFNACVNLGGFANVSYHTKEGRIGYDICPVNIVLNELAGRLGFPFDPDGKLASDGEMIDELFNHLELLEFYQKPAPRSLGREWIEQYVSPLLKSSTYDVKNLLNTFTHHAASQIARNIPQKKGSSAVFTGGGTHNTFLMNLIKERSTCNVVIPDNDIINYKEALIFALLGILRYEGMTNCLAKSTGASIDCSGGAIHQPPLNRHYLQS